MRALILIALLLFLNHAAAAADCPALSETGSPLLNTPAHVTQVCHAGYTALHDDDLLIPRWVAYRLTSLHSMGCLKPFAEFHAEDILPPGRRAEPTDYRRSGFDRGHQAPAEDFAWDLQEEQDSFSMVNAVPQLPGLNREGWEYLEQTVRAWAWTRGAVVVFAGPILTPQPPTIGDDRVAVPIAFFKVVYDPQTEEAIAFLMPQRYVTKGDLSRWITSVADIQERTGITFPLPRHIDIASKSPLWPADIPGWRRAHRQECTAEKQLLRQQ
jgi:endonuclease G